MKTDKFKQEDFVKVFIERGLTHRQASTAYSAMIDAMEQALVNKQTMVLAHLATIHPHEVKPRQYRMRCRRKKGGALDPTLYEFQVGTRVKFIFKMRDTFGRRYGFR